jgi:biopolymer transport protein ExbD
MKFPRNAKVFRGQLDVAPFASVFFLLVILLFLNSSVVFVPGLRIHLPEASSSRIPGISGPTVAVALDVGGQLYFANQVIKPEQLRVKLLQAVKQTPELTVIIQADNAADLDAFYQLTQLVMDTGIREVLVASRPSTAALKSSAVTNR